LKPDIVIWLNTIDEGRFEDTNKMFEKPQLVDWVIDNFLSDEQIEGIAEEIKLVV